jgi:hypothetical protein
MVLSTIKIYFFENIEGIGRISDAFFYYKCSFYKRKVNNVFLKDG